VTAREDVLGRIRTALGDTPRGVTVPRGYRQADGELGDIELLADRLTDYRANVVRVATAGLPDVIRSLLQQHGSTSVVLPPGLPETWVAAVPDGCATLTDDVALTVDELDAAGSVVTACALALAETGTIVLDHGAGQGRRALTLLPDHHIVVVGVSQIVTGVVDAVAVLAADKPMTWISGPSATSDIELDRVEGVHGPRQLDVVLVTDG